MITAMLEGPMLEAMRKLAEEAWEATEEGTPAQIELGHLLGALNSQEVLVVGAKED